MIKKIERFFDKIFDNRIFKVLSVYVLGILMFYLASSTVNRIISKYFTIDEKLILHIPKFIFVVLFTVAVIYVLYKIALKKYQPSIFLIHSLVVSSLIYLVLKWGVDKDGWDFILFSSKLLYIDFLGVLLVLTIILTVINLLSKNEFEQKPNPFISDDPILLKGDDKLNYNQRASKIVEYLERSNFKNSFTIGIVGP